MRSITHRLSLIGLLSLMVMSCPHQAEPAESTLQPAGMAQPKPDELVVTVPHVFNSYNGGLQPWLSCRVPVQADLRVQMTDEVDPVFEYNSDTLHAEAGAWVTWKLNTDGWWSDYSTIRLYILPRGGKVDGAVFVVSHGKQPTPAALNSTHGETSCMPNPARIPTDSSARFKFGVDTAADVDFRIFASTSPGGPIPLIFDRRLRRMPAGTQTVSWKLKTRDGSRPPPGSYVARFDPHSSTTKERMATTIIQFTIVRAGVSDNP